MSVNRSRYAMAAPAKLNLFLEVLARRADGFHQLETLMVPLTLHDTIEVEVLSEGSIHLECRPAAHHPWRLHPDQMPSRDDNLVVRAARAVQETAGIAQGARIVLIKRLPVGAGLGGGSSDAAATLLATNAAWNAGLTPTALQTLAEQLGSDVPFFLNLQSGIYSGRGELLVTPVRLPTLTWVIVAPERPNATADVFRCNRLSLHPQACGLPPNRVHVLGRRELGRLLFNRLQEPASMLNPDVPKALTALRHFGLHAVSMTGSGSACFALADHWRQAICVANGLRGSGWKQVFLATNINRQRIVSTNECRGRTAA